MTSDKSNTADILKSVNLVTDSQGIVRSGNGAFDDLLPHRAPSAVADKHLKDLFPAQLAIDLVHLVHAAQQQEGLAVSKSIPSSEQWRAIHCRATMLPPIGAGARLVLLQLENPNGASGSQQYDSRVLFSSTRHDINNPLTAIIGFSELLKLEESPDKRARYANLIHSEADRCRRALEKAEYFALQPKPIFRQLNINDVIRTIAESRKLPQELEGVTCDLNLDPSVSSILGDLHQIEFVVYSILLNAEQSLLGKSANKQIRISTIQQRDGVVVEIQDTGKGIPQSDLEQVFRPFQPSKQRGGGLGLAIAKRIITSHDGSIELESVVREGTTVRIIFKHRTHEAHTVQPSSGGTVAGKRVLIVEPRHEIVSLYSELLTLEGAVPFGATTIHRAVQVLEEEPIDLLVIDESIPSKDAKRIAAAVSLQPKPTIPTFVGMVENIHTSDCQHWLREWGANGTEKPLTPQALARFLRE